MHSIILVSPQVDRWRDFADALKVAIPAEIVKARSGTEAMETARKINPLAVAIDAELGDMAGGELVKRLLPINAMIYTALVSDLSEEVFHEETEGLGILMKLSSAPDPAEAGRLAECLRKVGGAV